MDESIIIRFILLGALLGLSAFFAGCEAAFFSLNQLKLDHLKAHRGRRGELVASLLSNPRQLLTVIYVGNELVNVACAAVVTSISMNLFGSKGVGIAIGAGTFIILAFGEITPKTVVLRYAEGYALNTAPILRLFRALIKPLIWVLTGIADRSVLLFASPKDEGDGDLTEEEIKTIVSMGEGEGVIETDESEMIHNIFEFGETTASEIMTPKNDIFSIDVNTPVPDIISRTKKSFFSRIPVYEENKDNIMGVLYMKDILRLNIAGKKSLSLRQMLHKPFIIPESKKVSDLLRDFKLRKVHLAISYDEYGSLMGLVSMEDVLEEIVGEIEGELQKDRVPIIKKNEEEFYVLAGVSIHDFNKEFGSAIPEDDEYNSIGGFVFSLIGRLPIRDESVCHESVRFIVDKLQGPRIVRLLVKVKKNEEAEKKKTNIEG